MTGFNPYIHAPVAEMFMPLKNWLPYNKGEPVPDTAAGIRAAEILQAYAPGHLPGADLLQMDFLSPLDKARGLGIPLKVPPAYPPATAAQTSCTARGQSFLEQSNTVIATMMTNIRNEDLRLRRQMQQVQQATCVPCTNRAAQPPVGIQLQAPALTTPTPTVAMAAPQTPVAVGGKMFSRSQSHGKAAEYEQLIQKYAEKYHVPIEMALKQAQIESDFCNLPANRCGAIGIMQITEAEAAGNGDFKGPRINPHDPEQNIERGMQLMASHFKYYMTGAGRKLNPSGDSKRGWELALAAYNAGRGAVSKHGGVPPFKETQHYIAKIGPYIPTGVA